MVCFMFGRGSLTDVCFTNSDSNDARTLSEPTDLSFHYNIFTVEKCVDACQQLGDYPYAGVEVGIECCMCHLFDELSSPDQTPHFRVWQ